MSETIKYYTVTCPRCGRQIQVAEWEFVTLCKCFTFLFVNGEQKESTPSVEIAEAS